MIDDLLEDYEKDMYSINDEKREFIKDFPSLKQKIKDQLVIGGLTLTITGLAYLINELYEM
jgi:hypothetical protein